MLFRSQAWPVAVASSAKRRAGTGSGLRPAEPLRGSKAGLKSFPIDQNAMMVFSNANCSYYGAEIKARVKRQSMGS